MATSACFLVLFDFCYFVVGGDGDAGLLLLQLPIFFLCSVLQLLCVKRSLLFSPVYLLFSKILVAWYHLLLSLGKFHWKYLLGLWPEFLLLPLFLLFLIWSFHTASDFLHVFHQKTFRFIIFFDWYIHLFYYVFRAWDSLLYLLYSEVYLSSYCWNYRFPFHNSLLMGFLHWLYFHFQDLNCFINFLLLLVFSWVI